MPLSESSSHFDLVLETSTSVGSIALGNSEVIVQQMEFAAPLRASQALFPALARIGLPRLKLRRIIVGLGPGSFSGIRVALAAAQGIALAQGCPVVGISSAYATARPLAHVTRLGIYADAKRQEMFCTEFSLGKLERSAYLIPASQLEESASRMTLAVSAEPLAVPMSRMFPRAADFLSLPDTLEGWQRDQNLEPIYLRGAEPMLSNLTQK